MIRLKRTNRNNKNNNLDNAITEKIMTKNPIKTINLPLTINEVNVIIKALSERPFREVYELVGKIHQYSRSQLTSDQLQPKGNVE